MKAAYARVSTSDQTTQQQLDRLRAIAPGSVEFIDDAVSGRLESRPKFDRLRAAIERRELQEVYVCKIDRLGRSAKAILDFFEQAEKHGVRVVVTDQGVDTSTPVGKVVRTILAALAELEADLIRERTQQAMDAFKAGTRTTRSGRPVGRPRVLTDEKVERIRELRYGRGLPWKEVAQHVGIAAVTCRKVKAAPPTATPRVLNKQNAPEGTGADPPSPQGDGLSRPDHAPSSDGGDP